MKSRGRCILEFLLLVQEDETVECRKGCLLSVNVWRMSIFSIAHFRLLIFRFLSRALPLVEDHWWKKKILSVAAHKSTLSAGVSTKAEPRVLLPVSTCISFLLQELQCVSPCNMLLVTIGRIAHAACASPIFSAPSMPASWTLSLLLRSFAMRCSEGFHVSPEANYYPIVRREQARGRGGKS